MAKSFILSICKMGAAYSTYLVKLRGLNETVHGKHLAQYLVHRGRLIHADTIIIFGANPFLLVDLETARFASLPAMHISESSTPSAGHTRIHYPGGCSLKGTFLSVLGQLDSKTRTSHLSIWGEGGERGEGEGKRRMEQGRGVFHIPSPLSTQEKLRAF